MSPRLFILDGPGFLFRAYHALPYLSTSRGMPVNAILGMSTMLWKLLREEQPDYFAVAWDPPGPTFREEKFAAYKETRAATPDDLRRQIPVVMQLFEALRLPVLEVPGFEADDVLGTVVDRARAQDLDVVLVTSDKDMLQLVGPRVRVLAPGARAGEQVLYDADKVREKWGVGPEQIPDLLALMGDSIDNIPGVPGVGQKTAVKLIGQFGSVDGLYEHLTLVPGKLRETLAANRKQALLSRELATVSTRVPLPEDLEAPAAPGAGLGAPARAVDRARAAHPAAPAPGAARRAGGGGGRAARRQPRGPGRLSGQGSRGRAARGGLDGGGRAAESRGHARGPASPGRRRRARGRGDPRAAGRPHAHRARPEAPAGVVARARRAGPSGGGHRGGRVSPQLGAQQLQARGSVRRAPGRGAGARAPGRAGRAGCGSSGSRRRASCGRPPSARSTTRSSARSSRSSPPWSATASPWIPRASPSSRRSWIGASAT